MTMITNIEFFVPGTPVSQGSMKSFVPKGARFPVVVHSKNSELQSWRGIVAHTAINQMTRMSAKMIISGAIKIKMVFVLRRPKSHYGTGKNSRTLKPLAPMWHDHKPDLDKLQRSILDALTGVVWTDDSQVSQIDAVKMYGVETGVLINIIELPLDNSHE